MIYSNDEPTPTQFRPRTYAITCDNDLTNENFDLQYAWPIRMVNSQWPTCKFFIMALSDIDNRVEDFLRKDLGVSPARITIYHFNHRSPANKYRSAVKGFDSWSELEDDYVLYSTHDILWHAVPEGLTERIKLKREKKNKVQPFIDTMPLC
jgi:hypothetical protein